MKIYYLVKCIMNDHNNSTGIVSDKSSGFKFGVNQEKNYFIF